MNEEQRNAQSDVIALIKICNDGAEGYQKAAKNTENINLKTLFNKIAQQRISYAARLDREARLIYGEEVGNVNSIFGDIHQFWIDVKATFSGNSDEALLEECVRGEKAAIEAYKRVIDDDKLPYNIMEIARMQYHEINGAYRMLDVLENVVD